MLVFNRKFPLPYLIIALALALGACSTDGLSESAKQDSVQTLPEAVKAGVDASQFTLSDSSVQLSEDSKAVRFTEPAGWLDFEVTIPETGRYQAMVNCKLPAGDSATIWIEDYVGNPDERSYNVTAGMLAVGNGEWMSLTKDGTPLAEGKHNMRLHMAGLQAEVDQVQFTLLKAHQYTPDTMVQQTEGENWVLVWSDEFEGNGLPDPSKWTYDFGDWGWGNNEPQYYTENRIENARQEGGNLVIEARKNDDGHAWTSARLTTRGKVSFLYGKIEFSAKVPVGDGTWAAGWLLGDAYRDELSWPYCGEIDVLETTGNEIDDVTGDGQNHASCHTRAYYFKINNHITAITEVPKMDKQYHTYTIEWLPSGVKAYLDGEHYYTYDKLNGDWEWPFSQPQNLIINLAMGGGMGGDIDPALTSQQLIVDYIKVYELR